ncbi:hypothetical protein CGC21_10920 [Leishmania donovani]|uniref:Uncharacterized protein n=1 Tax=Leishmania donovani TaxID=5661 RepID=A0A504X5W3_LEIDO|nr:hypothetical protein CGC21_10920 [Leishmania donovani]
MAYSTDHKSWLAKLVAFDTVNVNLNVEMLDYIKGYLKTPGIDSTHIYNPESDHDSPTESSAVLFGYAGVLSVDGHERGSDPFVLIEEGGKLFGRGTCDMRGFAALCVAPMPRLTTMRHTKPVLHSSTVLMSTSCNGFECNVPTITTMRQISVRIKRSDTHNLNYRCLLSCMPVATITGCNAEPTLPVEFEFVLNMCITKTPTQKHVGAEVKGYITTVILSAMCEGYADASIEIHDWAVPAYRANEKHPFTMMLREMMNGHAICKAGGCAESGLFAETLSIQTLILGPGGKSGHRVNK